ITGESQTGNTGDLDQVSFSNAGTVASGHKFTSLTIGPDNKLYGLKINGDIFRWSINSDGSLSNQEILTSWKSAYGSRTAIGLTFDPNATASNLIAYVSHCSGSLNNAPAWDGRLSRISGNNLQNEELLLTNLPRSIRDHLTNSIAFRPGEPNALYFLQGSNSAGGAPDGSWGNRPERLLSAALLRLDLSKLPSNLPLDVQTSMDQSVINSANTNSPSLSDGSYNPYYTDAALQLYATGIRNAYDLVWHSNGQLYIPTNGTAGGSNSPASVNGTRRPDGSFYSGQTVPALNGNQTQRDWLFRVNPATSLGYYGHPNPLRGEYVLNRGPLDEADYPANISPDVNYRGAAFDFEFNKSPNGVIEYKTAGNLQGAILVCRYSGGSDLIALVPDGPNGDVQTSKIGIPGFTGFDDPLDLTEDVSNGNLYVSDYGRSQIVLLKPNATSPANLVVSTNKVVLDAAVNSNENFSITLSNTGGQSLNNLIIGISGSSQFSSATSNIASLAAGASVELALNFSPTQSGPTFSSLNLSADGNNSESVSLQGLGINGEPSLQHIFDAHFGTGAIDVADDNVNTTPIHSTDFADPIRGEEVAAQIFQVADPTLPVNIEVLASFGPQRNGAVSGFGWYEAGNPTNATELIRIDDVPTGNRRSLNPVANGTFTFIPTTQSFGFISRWPAFNDRLIYTEDEFNTFASSIGHHVRAYPHPEEINSFILVIEEATFGFDYQDIVVAVKNVQASTNGFCFTEENGEVIIEAENFTESIPGTGNAANTSWTIINDADASSSTAIEGSPNTGVWTGLNLNGPRLDYDINFAETGTYFIYVRSAGPSGNDDSYHVGLDGIAFSNKSSFGMGGQGSWAWKNLANEDELMQVDIQSSGKHTFNLWLREDGVQVDKIILKKANASPSGQGPSASGQGPCTGNASQALTNLPNSPGQPNTIDTSPVFSAQEIAGNGIIHWGNFFEEFKDTYTLERSVDGSSFEVLENAEIIVDENFHTHTDP
ncbi:MAG: hypothetical protein AAF696_30255, partial [Bacteroidota bacterium]